MPGPRRALSAGALPPPPRCSPVVACSRISRRLARRERRDDERRFPLAALDQNQVAVGLSVGDHLVSTSGASSASNGAVACRGARSSRCGQPRRGRAVQCARRRCASWGAVRPRGAGFGEVDCGRRSSMGARLRLRPARTSASSGSMVTLPGLSVDVLVVSAHHASGASSSRDGNSPPRRPRCASFAPLGRPCGERRAASSPGLLAGLVQ